MKTTQLFSFGPLINLAMFPLPDVFNEPFRYVSSTYSINLILTAQQQSGNSASVSSMSFTESTLVWYSVLEHRMKEGCDRFLEFVGQGLQ